MGRLTPPSPALCATCGHAMELASMPDAQFCINNDCKSWGTPVVPSSPTDSATPMQRTIPDLPPVPYEQWTDAMLVREGARAIRREGQLPEDAFHRLFDIAKTLRPTESATTVGQNALEQNTKRDPLDSATVAESATTEAPPATERETVALAAYEGMVREKNAAIEKQATDFLVTHNRAALAWRLVREAVNEYDYLRRDCPDEATRNAAWAGVMRAMGYKAATTEAPHKPSCSSWLAWDIPHSCDCRRPSPLGEPLSVVNELWEALCELQEAYNCWCDAGDENAVSHSPACARARRASKRITEVDKAESHCASLSAELAASESSRSALTEELRQLRKRDEPVALELARHFHEVYETLAPLYGYETRKESAVPWAAVPNTNRMLMTAVCAAVLWETRVENRALTEELRRVKQDDWRQLSVCAVGAENASVSEYMDHWEGRTLKAEAEVRALTEEIERLREAIAEAANELENDPRARTCHNVAAALRSSLSPSPEQAVPEPTP